VAQRDGVLFLGVNEGDLADNTGTYDVVIEAEGRQQRQPTIGNVGYRQSITTVCLNTLQKL
jgi:hypothetical protein